jgi:hypothetical protein
MHVEAEPARLVAANLGVGRLREEAANLVEHLDVGGRIRSGRAADGRLVDVDDLVKVLRADDLAVRAGIDFFGTVQVAGELLVENVVDQGAFAATGHTGHANEPTQRQRRVNVLEIVVGRPEDGEPVDVAIRGVGGR